MFTKDELEIYLQERWAARGCHLAKGDRMGIAVSELVAKSVERNSQVEAPYVDLWIAVLDEFISWEISLLTIFFTDRKESYKLTDFDRSITMILCKIIGDSIAIRHLILLGYDTSARTLLRSAVEYMELYVAILNDPQLAHEFIKTDTPEQGRAFWKDHLASGGIRKKMYAAWQEFFRDNADRGAAQWFSNWGNSSNDMLSAMIHPSYMGGLFTAIPFKTVYNEENWLGIWGDKSEGSAEIIYIYANYVFAMFLLYRNFPFKGFGAHMAGGRIKYDRSNELHKHVKIGRDILASLILSLGTETNRPHVFPEIDMSIWDN